MKYLFITTIVLGIFWLWRQTRLGKKSTTVPPNPPARPSNGATQIVACSVCQIHLPYSEALMDHTGQLYCCETHRHKVAG